MPIGKTSRTKLGSAHPDLVRFVEELSRGVDAGECPGVRDITVLCTFRGMKEQDKAFAEGNSKLKWPMSKHNRIPSLAVDVAPYPVDWYDTKAFLKLRTYALEVAGRIGVRLRIIEWDLPHYELAEERLPR